MLKIILFNWCALKKKKKNTQKSFKNLIKRKKKKEEKTKIFQIPITHRSFS